MHASRINIFDEFEVWLSSSFCFHDGPHNICCSMKCFDMKSQTSSKLGFYVTLHFEEGHCSKRAITMAAGQCNFFDMLNIFSFSTDCIQISCMPHTHGYLQFFWLSVTHIFQDGQRNGRCSVKFFDKQ